MLGDSGTLKTGQRPVIRQEKVYKVNEDLFKEGERGNEMFVVQEGEVCVLKNTDEGAIQLAKLGTGAMIGEMALLDNMPRSATVRAVKPTKVMVINRLVFDSIMEKVPLWLRSIVKIVTSRLRDANTRVGKSLVRDRECAAASMVALMLQRYGKGAKDKVFLPFNHLLNFSMFTTRMSNKAVRAALESLQKRTLAVLEKDTEGDTLVTVADAEALKLFVEFRKLKAQGKEIMGADLTDPQHEFLGNIAYVAQKHGKQTADGYFLPFSALDFGDEKTNRSAIKEFEKKGILSAALPGMYGDEEGILYDRRSLYRIKKVKSWIGKFRLETEGEQKKP
ncbi:MAG: hypothetical protein A2268_10680 [Candidatus Raymondbacteria bacterium RifOxyA12_full_50_37]|nr:MAG: hypothetical protein A2268_10680 [Candidatus Raymondbacteria bacterium RifOxyA12_full_50_37]OGJ85429.1 MAG: hypothetical protein A2248_12465 [Candidatus Raymondbacteria bacterium RIFOXYA2_FULL_49_16]OGJ91051.1 MAG: hypothetical protein A2350_07445 [Candidatus Raymondbacteria bacterium RifOxyB12_full_50_8]OGJ94937.1 MAG: hypothetical protein A2453_07935 [Candidatus Raymondbacteria bacterium RIFOXYC2_FULL_50_21]OGP45569.1 MAG: hypothetical protein A2324_04325 [Candidatus Raymondbacteria b